MSKVQTGNGNSHKNAQKSQKTIDFFAQRFPRACSKANCTAMRGVRSEMNWLPGRCRSSVGIVTAPVVCLGNRTAEAIAGPVLRLVGKRQEHKRWLNASQPSSAATFGAIVCLKSGYS